MHPSICIIGSVNVDLTFRSSRLPVLGETLAGTAFHIGFGGKGANQAIAAARLQAPTALVARVGDDVFGHDALRHLRSERLDTRHVRVDAERPTGVAAIMVDDQARNCILVIAGANQGLSSADIQSAKPAIEGAGVVIAQLEVPLETVLAAFRLAKSAGARTILNPAPAQPLPKELLNLTDLCAPNETELHILTGLAVGSLDEITAAARSLRDGGARSVVVTLGERGALLVDQAGVVHVPPRQVRAVDPTGAGDTFIGSLAAFLSEGLDLRAAIHNANVAAALSVTRPGAQAAPTRAELDHFLVSLK